VTLPGIDPGTVRLVAQCLNHYANPGPACFLASGQYQEQDGDAKYNFMLNLKEVEKQVLRHPKQLAAEKNCGHLLEHY